MSGWKVNTPLLLHFSGRTLSHEKYPFTGHFGNTHAVIWVEGPGCNERNLCAHISTTIFIGCSRRPTWVQPSRRIRSRLHDIKLLGWTCLAGWDPGPPPPPHPHSVLFRVRICLFPLFESTPYLRTANISEPPFRGLFAGFSCLGDLPKSWKMLNVPPKFGIISQETKEMREKKKKHPFFKEMSGWKVNTPLFLHISGRTLSHEKYPFTGHFGNTHGVRPFSEWGGGGAGVETCNSGGFRKGGFNPRGGSLGSRLHDINLPGSTRLAASTRLQTSRQITV